MMRAYVVSLSRSFSSRSMNVSLLVLTWNLSFVHRTPDTLHRQPDVPLRTGEDLKEGHLLTTWFHHAVSDTKLSRSQPLQKLHSTRKTEQYSGRMPQLKQHTDYNDDDTT